MATLTHKPKEEKPDLLFHDIMESLRISYQESYGEEDMALNKEILTSMMDDIKHKLKNRKLPKQIKVRLINLLDKFQDLYEAQFQFSGFDSIIEAPEGISYEEYLNTIPGWRLHKKFQSSLETELLPNTPSQ